MKNLLLSALVATSSIATVAIANVDRLSAQTVAQESSTTPRFYCGKTLDPSSNKELPTTLLMSSDSSEPIVIAIWNSEYFGSGLTPQQRCETVSPKFQTAVVDQQRTKIAAGIEKQTGRGIICAIATNDEVCDRSKTLYTLRSYQNAHEIVDRLGDAVNKNVGLMTCVGSAGNRRAIDIKHLLGRK